MPPALKWPQRFWFGWYLSTVPFIYRKEEWDSTGWRGRVTQQRRSRPGRGGTQDESFGRCLSLPCPLKFFTDTHTHTHPLQQKVSPRVLSTCLEDDPLENRDLSKFVSCPQNWSRFFSFGSLLYSCRLRQACRIKTKMFLWLRSTASSDNFMLGMPIMRNMQYRRPSLSVTNTSYQV